MGALVVVDSGVLIGVIDGADTHHVAARAALDQHVADDLRLPASAYVETMVRPAREGKLEEVRADVEALGLTVEPLGGASAEAAARLRARHGLRLPDALVLGHAEAIGADVVLTTDAKWLRISPRVRFVG